LLLALVTFILCAQTFATFNLSNPSNPSICLNKIEIIETNVLISVKEIQKIGKLLDQNGNTCVPLSIFCKRNKVKVKIGVVKGKKLWDKKESIKKKDIQRELKRQLNINI